MITVFHAPDAVLHDSYVSRNHGELAKLVESHRKDYRYVATVDTDDLEVAFMKTNNIECDWQENKEISAHADGPQRSTSVGDILTRADGTSCVVAIAGYVELSDV